MDLRKQKALQLLKNGRIKKLKDGFAVQSQNSLRYYFVDKAFTCTCPDCKVNKTPVCKHAFAVKYYLGIEKPSGTVEKVKLTYKQAWSTYNQAQNNEVNLFDKLLSDLIEVVEEPEPKKGAGRPNLSLKEQLFCSTQKVYSQLSSRRAKSLFNNAQERGLLKQSPHSNAVNKFFNRKDLTPILQKLIAVSSAPLKKIESKFAIDSTGFRTTRFNEYCKEKHDTKKKHNWIKLHAVCGVKTNIITGAVITNSVGVGTGDATQLPELVEQTNQTFEATEYSADKAYSSRNNLQFIDEKNAVPFIPFKKNTIPRIRGGGQVWRKMFHYFALNQEEFLQHYHVRSNIETTFHMIKSKFGDSVKSKNWTAQQNELLAKVLCHNIVVVIHEMHELGISADFKSLVAKN